jgi:hypothetical protein
MGLERLEYENIGIVLDPLVSLMNHSCDPNAIYLFEGTVIRDRALKPVAIWEGVCVNTTAILAGGLIRFIHGAEFIYQSEKKVDSRH